MRHANRSPMSVEPLEDRSVPAVVQVIDPLVAYGSSPGGGTVLASKPYRVLEGSGTPGDPSNDVVRLLQFTPFGSGFTGGVSVATVELTGDTTPDIIMAAAGVGGPHVKIYDGRTEREIRSFFAYDPAFRGGVTVAVGFIDGDNVPDIITGTVTGAAHVKVFSGATGAEIRSFFAFDPSFRGGVSVAAADVTADGSTDIIVGAGPGGAPHVKVFDGRTGAVARSFFAYDPGYTGGVNVAAAAVGLGGDVDGDRWDDIVTGATAGAPHVKAFSGRTGAEIRSFYASPELGGGVTVAVADVAGSGRAEIVAGTAAGVRLFGSETGAVVELADPGVVGPGGPAVAASTRIVASVPTPPPPPVP